VVTDTPAKAELERQDLLRKTTVKAKARATTKQKTSKKQPKFNKSSVFVVGLASVVVVLCCWLLFILQPQNNLFRFQSWLPM